MADKDNLIKIEKWLKEKKYISHLSSDSRNISEGDVFMAFKGKKFDGRDFILNAINSGAKTILFDPIGNFRWDKAWEVDCLAVPNLSSLAGKIASNWYSIPEKPVLYVGITGTNGKTSCSHWIAQALSKKNIPSTVIGSLGVGQYFLNQKPKFKKINCTTPNAVLLNRFIAKLKLKGSKAIVIEASSIGIDQGRIDTLKFEIAVFTNLSHDHMDYHSSMSRYELVKRKLFEWPSLKHAVINVDDPAGKRLILFLKEKRPKVNLISYSLKDTENTSVSKIIAKDIRINQKGTSFTICISKETENIKSLLIGDFNISNILAVSGVLSALKFSLPQIKRAIESLSNVEGRLEQIGGQNTPLIIIDYAHTPDAMKKVLKNLRKISDLRNGKLWCVFGCGGNRDSKKRSKMGKVSQMADSLVITSDNPRNENLEKIISDIVIGIKNQSKDHFHIIHDRGVAILFSIRNASKNDVVLIAGKGDEEFQEVKGKKYPFRDYDHASMALASRSSQIGDH